MSRGSHSFPQNAVHVGSDWTRLLTFFFAPTALNKNMPWGPFLLVPYTENSDLQVPINCLRSSSSQSSRIMGGLGCEEVGMQSPPIIG